MKLVIEIDLANDAFLTEDGLLGGSELSRILRELANYCRNPLRLAALDNSGYVHSIMDINGNRVALTLPEARTIVAALHFLVRATDPLIDRTEVNAIADAIQELVHDIETNPPTRKRRRE